MGVALFDNGAENQMGLNYVGIRTAARVPFSWILPFSVETHGVRLCLGKILRLFLLPLKTF